MERKQVTNGCSGSCCEKFTLPVNMEDLVKMKEEYSKVQLNGQFDTNRVECSNGVRRYPPPEGELDKLIDMLIPLGTSDYDPQNEKSFSDHWNSCKRDDGSWDVGRMGDHFVIINNEVHANIFTCRHFDTVNRICGNYENRPHLCKNFGSGCHYKGCGFVANLEAEEDRYLKSLQINGEDPIGLSKKYMLEPETS